MTREKRDKAWDIYEKAIAKAEDAYRKDVEPAWEKYLKSIHEAKANLIGAISSKNLHLPDEKRILEPAWGKGLPCPFMPIICRDNHCPCQTYSDFQKAKKEQSDIQRLQASTSKELED